MTDLTGTIVELLRGCVQDRRLSVGLFYRGDISVAQRVISEGHRTVLFGDRFQKLYQAHHRLERDERSSLTIIETDFKTLPISDRSLDILILSCGLPKGDPPVVALTRLRSLLKPGGLLVWPHPMSDGFTGKLSRAVDNLRRRYLNAALRRQFCTWTMEAGFAEVGQTEISGVFFPWAVTTGRAGLRPWEAAQREPSESVYYGFRAPTTI